jgi:DNA-binding transcriptional LysR family regulator
VGEFYAAGHPTRIRVLSEVLGGVWEALLAQRADIAITEVEGRGAAQISHRPLGAVSFVFAVAPGHALVRAQQPIKVADIRQHRVVVIADSARTSAPRSTGIASAADVLTVPTLAASVAAQVAGVGVGFLPRAAAAGPIARGELTALRVAAPKPSLLLSVAWRSAEHGPAARWFVERLLRLELG